MKLKHHLWIAFAIIFAALFFTSINTTVEIPMTDAETTETTLWDIAHDNLFTQTATDEAVEGLVEMMIPEAMAIELVEEHGVGNNVLAGILAFLPLLAAIAGAAIVAVQFEGKKYVLYGLLGVALVSVWILWFTAPTQLDGIESLFNELIPTMGTLIKDSTSFAMGFGLFIATLGSLYGVAALVLNQLGKIEE